MQGTVNRGPTIVTNGGGSSRSIDAPGGLSTSGIECISKRWQRQRSKEFSRQPSPLAGRVQRWTIHEGLWYPCGSLSPSTHRAWSHCLLYASTNILGAFVDGRAKLVHGVTHEEDHP
jgi:hypothetical protein